MNWLIWGLPGILGVATVVQSGLNRRLGGQLGLPAALLINSAVLAAATVALYFATRLAPQAFPETLWRPDPAAPRLSPAWLVVPGVMGFLIVLGLPYGIARLGALQVIVGFVAVQLVAAIAWDAAIEGIAVSPLRVAGAALAVAGTLLALKGGN